LKSENQEKTHKEEKQARFSKRREEKGKHGVRTQKRSGESAGTKKKKKKPEIRKKKDLSRP